MAKRVRLLCLIDPHFFLLKAEGIFGFEIRNVLLRSQFMISPVSYICTIFAAGHPVNHRPPQSNEASCSPITPLPSRKPAHLWKMVGGTSRGLPHCRNLSLNSKGKKQMFEVYFGF